MQANRKLINAFRSAAERVKTIPSVWDWGEFTSCNCGLIAKELDLDDSTLLDSTLRCADWVHFADTWISSGGNPWIGDEYCPATNLAISRVINTLSINGLEPQDLIELEQAEVEDANELVDYFLETADRLERELLSQSVSSQEEKVTQQQTVSL